MSNVAFMNATVIIQTSIIVKINFMLYFTDFQYKQLPLCRASMKRIQLNHHFSQIRTFKLISNLLRTLVHTESNSRWRPRWREEI